MIDYDYQKLAGEAFKRAHEVWEREINSYGMLAALPMLMVGMKCLRNGFGNKQLALSESYKEAMRRLDGEFDAFVDTLMKILPRDFPDMSFSKSSADQGLVAKNLDGDSSAMAEQ
jgi:hypothetical protein